VSRNRLDRLTKALATFERVPMFSWDSPRDARELLLYVNKVLASADRKAWGTWWPPDTYPPEHRALEVPRLLASIARQFRRHHMNYLYQCPWPEQRLIDLASALVDFLARSQDPHRPRPPRPPRPHVRSSAPSLDAQIIATGYKVLAARLHPDRGGSEERMKELNAAVERLRRRQ
jgi:hypothetical protein